MIAGDSATIAGLSVLAAAGTETAFVADLLVILASAGVIALVMQRMRLAVIPAYLIAGALLGPHAFGLIPAPGSLAAIGHLAIMLLLFGIGLELHLGALRHGLAQMLSAGVASCLLSVLLGWPVARLFGLSWPAALSISMALSLSSTAVVLRIIAQRRELRHARGRMALAILVVQDMLVLGMLAILPALAKWTVAGQPTTAGATTVPLPDTWGRFAWETLAKIGGVTIIVVFGRLALPRLLRESLRAGSLEVMMVVGVAAALAAAIAAHAIGFSMEMGAFLAGFILAGTPFRHQLSGQVGPLRDLFIAVFFTTVGMKLDPTVAAQAWHVIVLGVVVMLGLKALIIGGTCWTVGTTASVAVGVGFALAQAGEFSLILLSAAQDKGIIGSDVLAVVIAVVVLSLILTPALIDLGGFIARRVEAIGTAPWVGRTRFRDPHAGDAVGVTRRHAIVAGYGPVGWMVAMELERYDVPYVIVELNPQTVRQQSAGGRKIIFGDISNPDVLESADVAGAAALILTIPDENAVIRASTLAKRKAPRIFIAARITAVTERSNAVQSGADHVTIEEIETARSMLGAVARALDLPTRNNASATGGLGRV